MEAEMQLKIGGGGGIRTHETLRPGCFQDNWTKPLSDSSKTLEPA